MIELAQFFQRFFKCKDFLLSLRSQGHRFIQGHPSGSSAAFLPLSLPGMIHKNSPNGLRAHGKEMRPSLPIHSRLIDQPQIRFVNQRRRLKGMVPPLVFQMPRRQRPELVINQRHQLRRRRRAIPVLESDQKLGDFGSGHLFPKQDIRPSPDYHRHRQSNKPPPSPPVRTTIAPPRVAGELARRISRESHPLCVASKSKHLDLVLPVQRLGKGITPLK